MTDKDGNPYNNGEKVGAHSMVVTDVLPDGRYVVSSWGDEYIIDNTGAEYSNITYIKIDTDPVDDN